VYAVVLAGGGGTRLWPLSTPERPKPFLRLLGERTLIQRSVARLSPLLEARDVYVVAERRHLPLVREQLPAIPEANLLGEPVGRNTAAAAAFAAEAIDRPADEVMLVLPADAHVADEEGLRSALAGAAEIAATGCLVTLGVRPDRAETGYGYIVARPAAQVTGGRRAFEVERFVEKPSAEQAAELIATGLASWNAGIFAWTRAQIRARLDEHAPDIVGPIRAACERGATERSEALERAYPSLRATSIDYAVMEPASLEGAVSVVPIDVGWSDLGSWAALRDAWHEDHPEEAMPGSGERRDLGSSNGLVLARDRLVVTVGLTDTIVVDTPDALLVCSGERSQEVRTIAEQMAARRRPSGPEKGGS
jgi:mannose-1-phosphate guanylyltransferase/mannose-6-phosphate isomerase